MLIYNQEKLDGLEHIISDKINFQSQARCRTKYEIEQNVLTKVQASANPDQPDLFYMDSILVSVGWNKNDDIFDPEETWAAKNSPVDKQFNFMHNEKDIIGHITSSQILDENNEIYIGEAAPDKFHILVQSVLYKHWSDESLQERMDKTISEIQDGKWYVSMECLFPSFDYGIITPDGQMKVIARCEDTAFLTKHLRIYGGTGEYKGHKIGRLLRNFVFSGKGLVDEPANPDSVIFSSVKDFSGTKASIEILGKNMNEELQALTKQLEDAKAENKALADKIATFEQNSFESSLAAVKTENESLKTTIAELQKVMDDLKGITEQKDSEIAQAKEVTKQVQDELAAAKALIEQAKAEKVLADRVTKLVEAGLEKVEAEAVATKFTSTSDEIFDEVIKAYSKKGKAKDMPEDEEDDKKAMCKDKAEVITEDDVEEVEAAVASALDDNKKLEETKASIRSVLTQVFKKESK